MSLLPTITAEVSFTTGALQTASWTDISPYVRSVTIRRGRQYEMDTFEAGTCDLVLNDPDGRFDPLSTRGAYAPNLVPHKQLRVKATYGGTTYTLYKGYVERWVPTRSSKYVASANVTASDALALFARLRFPRHDDGKGGGSGRKNLGVYNYQTNALISGSNTGTNHTFSGNDEATRLYVLANATYLTNSSDAGPFHDHIVFKITYTNGDGTANRVGHFELKWPHHSDHPSHKWSARLNVTLQGNDTVHSIQKVERKSGKFSGRSLRLTMWGERPIIPRGTGDVQLISMLKRAGWPSSRVSVAGGVHGKFTQAPSSPWGASLLDSIRIVQDSEAGQIYIDRTGDVVFENREWRRKSWPSSPAVWGDGAGSETNKYSDLQASMDDGHIVNYWEVTRLAENSGDSPSAQVATSRASRRTYGYCTSQRQVTLQTDKDARALARYLLARTKTPQYRIPSLTIRPLENPSVLFPLVLPMEISDALVVSQHRPLSSNSLYSTSAQMNIDHITHTITPGNWVTELELAPRVTAAFTS